MRPLGAVWERVEEMGKGAPSGGIYGTPDHQMIRCWEWYLEAARRERDRKAFGAGWYPHYTESGRWVTLPAEAGAGWRLDGYDHGNWTAGFWIGTMWLLGLSGDEEAMERAAAATMDVAPRRRDEATHDLGYLFYPSFALPGALRGISRPPEAAVALEAAETLAHRFRERPGYIQAFGRLDDDRSAGISTIDTMMNLPLLWWAGAYGKDARARERALSHAVTAGRVFFRPDGSTWHMVRFDSESGELMERGTVQGASENSCWSRGQAWAASGFGWAFAATGEEELLHRAVVALDYFLERLPTDGVPPWDFTDLDGPRDASSGAIAAVACMVLGETHPSTVEAEAYRDVGVELLDKLCENAGGRGGEEEGILQRSSYWVRARKGVDCATAWGDFYLGLALALGAGKVGWEDVVRGGVAG